MKALALILILLIPFIAIADESKTESFDSFVKSFFAHENTQFNFIQFPFSMSQLVDGKDEPERVTTLLQNDSFHKIQKAINFQYKNALKHGATRHISKGSNSSVVLSFSGPDSGYLIYYYFANTTDGWKLYGFFNSST